ncbi:MAG: FecR family protein, partial [Chloroflexota bacterium]
EGTPSPLPTTAPLASSTPPPARAASITELLNTVQSRGTSAENWAAATVGQTLPGGGEVQTLEDGEARVDISPDTIVRLGPSTHFVVTDLGGSDEQPHTTLELIVGELWVILNSALDGGSFEVETPVGVATVRGSYLSVDYDLVSDSLIISCLEGLCSVRNQFGLTDLIAEQETLIRRGLPPGPPGAMDPDRLERWQRFVREARPFIAPALTRLAPTWRATSYEATRSARQTDAPRPSRTPALIQTLRAGRTPLATRTPSFILPTLPSSFPTRPGLLPTLPRTRP